MPATRKKAASAEKATRSGDTDKKKKQTTNRKDKAPSPEKLQELRKRIEQAPVMALDPAKMHAAPWNKRKIRLSSPSMKRLIKNVGKVGVLQNGIARAHPDARLAKKGEYQILGGHRRCIAAEKNSAKMPAKVIECSDEEARFITWMENAEREDIRPVEEAMLVADMLEHGTTVPQIAEALDQTESWVLRRTRLAELEPHWFEAWEMEPGEDGSTRIASFSMRHMEIVASLHPEARAALFNQITKGQIHVGNATSFEKHIERTIMNMISAAPWIQEDSDEILPEAGTCAACPHRTGAQGKLFADMTVGNDDDRCLNDKCWAKKLAAWVEYQRTKLTTEHGDKLVLLTRDTELQDGRRYREAWNTRPKSQEKGGVPALHIDGPEISKVIWIDPDYQPANPKPRSGKRIRKIEKDAEGKPTLESTQMATEDRIVKLDRQRKAWCVEYIYEKLTGIKARQPKPTEGVIPPLVRVGEPARRPASWAVIALSAAGVGSHRKEWPDPQDWKRYHDLLKKPEAERSEGIADLLWEEMTEIFSRRLRSNAFTTVDEPFADACELGELIGIPSADLWNLAKVAHAAPAGWAKDAEKAGFTLDIPESPLPPVTTRREDDDTDDPSDEDDGGDDSEEFDDGVDA